MTLRYATVILMAAMLVALALVASTIQIGKADAADTVTVTGCTGTSVVLDVNEKQMLDFHNQKRVSTGLSKLCVHPALQKAAESHSQEMIDKDYFSHNSANGESFSARVKSFGYNYRAVGENIAWGAGPGGTADSRFTSWMNSTGHKASILNTSYREVGIGAVTGTYKTYTNATMWTVDFGAR